MPARLSPLVRRTDLAPGESLFSMLIRLQQLNHYAPFNFIRALCLAGAEPDRDFIRFGYPFTGHGLARLSDLTQIGPAELYAASPHVFLRVSEPEAFQAVLGQLGQGSLPPRLPTTEAWRGLRGDANAAFCPECLQEVAYHRLAWLPRWAAACLKHRRLLAEGCPACRQFVTIEDVVAARCHQCQADLTRARTQRIGEDAFGLFSQQLVHYLLTLADRPRGKWFARLPCQSPPMLFKFLETLLGFLTANIPDDWLSIYMQRQRFSPFSFYRGLWVRDNYARAASAVRLLTPWPEGFYELIDMHLDVRYITERPRGGKSALAESGYDTTWQAFPFAQAALDQYLSSLGWPLKGERLSLPRNRPRGEAFVYLTLGGASRRIGTSVEMIQRLVEIGRLAQHDFVDSGAREEHAYSVLHRSEVLKLAKQWRHPLPLAEAAEWLGLPEATVLELAGLGVLVAYPGRHKNQRDWQFSKFAIGEFLARIARRAYPDYGGPLRHRSLMEAADMLAEVGLSLADLLKRLADGDMGAYQNRVLFPANLSALQFDAEKLEGLIHTTKAKNGWLTCKEVARQLEVTKPIVVRLINAKVLRPVAACGEIQYYDRSAVERLQRSPAEWVHFARGLTTSQMAEHLGLSQSRVLAQVKQGMLKPLLRPAAKSGGRYLFGAPLPANRPGGA